MKLTTLACLISLVGAAAFPMPALAGPTTIQTVVNCVQVTVSGTDGHGGTCQMTVWICQGTGSFTNMYFVYGPNLTSGGVNPMLAGPVANGTQASWTANGCNYTYTYTLPVASVPRVTNARECGICMSQNFSSSSQVTGPFTCPTMQGALQQGACETECAGCRFIEQSSLPNYTVTPFTPIDGCYLACTTPPAN